MNGNRNRRLAPKLVSQALRGALSFYCLLVFLFLIFHFLPSDPVETLLAKVTTGGVDRSILKEQLGLTRPLLSQVRTFISGILNGSLGTSLWTGQSVTYLITERLPTTFSLAVPALVLFFVFGIFSGFFQALWTNQLSGRSLRFLNSVLFCIPSFTLGTVLARTAIPINSALLALLIYVGATFPTLAVLIYKRILLEEKKPYSQAVRAKGMSRFQLYKNHLLRPCIPVALSLLPWWWSMFLGTSIIVEPLFRLDGVGLLALEAFRNQDLPVLLGLSLFIGMGRILLGLVRDLLFDFWGSEGVP